MFLRNYDNCIAGMNLVDNVTISYAIISNSTGIFADGYYNQRATNGAVASIWYNASSNTHAAMSLSARGICLGDGTTEVSYEDYRLSGNAIPNKLVEVSKNVTYNAATHKFKKTLVATYTNSGNADITISEWGLWRYNSQNGNSDINYSQASDVVVLVYRAVLDTPIVIEAGTTATLTFSIDIPMPNHP